MKPTLYLHCGIHKTGSSFLQTMFVRNRELLSKEGIHYPKSEKELEMLKGEITPGNGIHLANTIRKEESEVLNLLSKDLAEANRLNLQSVLYSSETLFHKFAEKGSVQKLCHAAEKAGFHKIVSLVYFRDPISHALSTYKHRAKNGDHPDFRFWITNDYETYDLIGAFLEYRETTCIEWSCRMYKPDSVHMVRTSFEDWLGIKSPEIPNKDRVNPSLKLNEIKVLQALKHENPGSENFLRDALLAVDVELKVSDKDIAEVYSNKAANELRRYQTLIDKLNVYMKENERLKIEYGDTRGAGEIPNISLSDAQIMAVANGIKQYVYSQQFGFKLKDVWSRGITKIKRKWTAVRPIYK